MSRIERRVFAPDCTRTQTHGCVHAVRFSISLILDALITAVRLVASRKNPPPSHATRFALNHRRPIIEGVLALQRRLVSGAPREIGRTTGGRALVPPFVRRRQASVDPRPWKLPAESFKEDEPSLRIYLGSLLVISSWKLFLFSFDKVIRVLNFKYSKDWKDRSK